MFTLPDLPYSYDSLEPYIDSQTMKLHHDKHHAAYTDNLNKALEGQDQLLNLKIEEILSNLNKVPEPLRQKVRNHGGGYANHNFFWTVMAPPNDGGKDPTVRLLTPINSTFGSLQTLKEKITATAMGHFGSGLAGLVLDKDKLEIIDTANQDSPISEGKIPLLALDVWEHAYYIKYQNRRADYINAWWNVVDWRQVEMNFLNATLPHNS